MWFQQTAGIYRLGIAKTELGALFRGGLRPRSHPNRKPHPEPLLTALQRLGAQPPEAIMIGDSIVDIQSAQAAQIRVGVLTHGHGTREVLTSAHPDWIVDSLSELISIF